MHPPSRTHLSTWCLGSNTSQANSCARLRLTVSSFTSYIARLTLKDTAGVWSRPDAPPSSARVSSGRQAAGGAAGSLGGLRWDHRSADWRCACKPIGLASGWPVTSQAVLWHLVSFIFCQLVTCIRGTEEHCGVIDFLHSQFQGSTAETFWIV